MKMPQFIDEGPPAFSLALQPNTNLELSEEARLVLKHAIEVLNERGWCQHQLSLPSGKVCAIGALGAAIRKVSDSDELPFTRNRLLRETSGAAVKVLNREGWAGFDLAEWNDNPIRTKRDVIGLFTKVIEQSNAL